GCAPKVLLMLAHILVLSERRAPGRTAIATSTVFSTRSSCAVLRCRAAAVHLDPQPRGGPHPLPPPDHRLPMAGPGPWRASPAYPSLPAQGRTLRRPRGRLRDLGGHRVALHPRNRPPARRPRP